MILRNYVTRRYGVMTSDGYTHTYTNKAKKIKVVMQYTLSLSLSVRVNVASDVRGSNDPSTVPSNMRQANPALH